MERYNYLFLFIIAGVFLFSRLLHLNITPAGIHYDEAGMAFDAVSLAGFGTDRHNNSFPFYLPAYGGGQSALYAYTLAFILKFIPFSVFVMRLPAVIYGIVAFAFSYKLALEITNDTKWGLLGPILVTITPYFMTSERWALDCNLFLSMSVVALYVYFRALKKDRYRDYILAGLIWGLTLYTYVLSYVVVPIFLLLSVIYLMVIKKINIKNYFAMAMPLGILALPLILMQLINMGKMQPFSFWIFDFPKLGFYRGGEMSLSAIPQNIDRIWMMLFRGNQYSFSCVPGFNPVYLVTIPLIVLGVICTIIKLVKSIRSRELCLESLILFYTIAGYLMVLVIRDDLNIYTGNELYICYVLFTIIGLKFISNRCNILTIVILFVLAIDFLNFSNFYFRKYNEVATDNQMFVSTEYGDVVKYVNEKINPKHKTVYFGRSPEHQSYPDVIVGLYLNADPSTWEFDYETKNMVDNVKLSLPENGFDMEEDCIYIFSKETYGHIYPYFIEQGWSCDDRWASYAIIYK